MYKVLVADDEKWIRKAIVQRVISFGLNIEMVGEASDGQEAYDMAIHLQPDIILTDIRMPGLSGLDLIEKIRQSLPDVKVIIISGYADFEYARFAMHLKVSKYILKTVDDDVLSETLKEVITQREQEKDTKKDIDALKTKLNERTLILQKNFINQLLSGKISDEDYIPKMVKNLDLPFEEVHCYCVMVMQLSDSNTIYATNSFTDELQEYLDVKGWKCFVYENLMGYNEVNIILYSSQDCFSKEMMHELSKELVTKFGKTIICIGISSPVDHCIELNRAYIQAMDSIKNRVLMKGNTEKHVHYDDISSLEKYTNYFTSDDERNLSFFIKSGNQKDIVRLISRSYENMSNSLQVSVKPVMKFYFEMILLLDNLLNKCDTSVEKVLEKDFVSLVNHTKVSQKENVKELLISYTLKVSDYILSCEKCNPRKQVEYVKEYIDNNYFEDISLETVSQKFYISKVYFSQQFKKEFGVSFVSYLTLVRMNNAQKLLRESRLKVHEIARMVGYSDPLYFGQVFKKYFGVLPSEYDIR